MTETRAIKLLLAGCVLLTVLLMTVSFLDNFGYGAPAFLTEAGEAVFAAEEDAPLLVNVNTAARSELEKLPGVGKVTAQLIIDYRDAHGPFRSVEELGLIKGIGSARLEKIKPYIVLTDEQK